jgi:hypothetical protein
VNVATLFLQNLGHAAEMVQGRYSADLAVALLVVRLRGGRYPRLEQALLDWAKGKPFTEGDDLSK